MKHNFSAAMDHMELRPLGLADIEQLRLLRNQNRRYFIYSGEISEGEQQVWYEKYLAAPGDYVFSVLYQNQWIGAVSIYHVNGKEAEFGRLLIDKQRAGRGGLGVLATRLACRIAFEQLGITELWLEAYCDNAAAQITYLKAGFLPVGIFADGKERSIMRMSLQRGSAKEGVANES